MSSLAGALDQPVRNTYDYASTYPAAHDLDVDMLPPDNEDEVKFAHTLKEEPATTHTAGGDEGMEDLFGQDAEVEEAKPDAGDAKSESIPTTTPLESGYDSDELSQAEKERRKALEYFEPDEPGAVVQQYQEANVPIPNIPIPRTSDGDHWVIRMPNFVKVDSKPFHPDTYVGPEQDEEELHQNESVREKSMTIKLRVENTVRWRWTKDEFGQDKRQSNSRVIRWSDGTLSLRLGKELFDINQTIDTSGGVVRQSLGGSQQQATQSTPVTSQHPPSGSKPQGLTYLVAQHKRSEVLQSEAIITGYMSLRPTGMQSETHRMLVRAVGQKHNKIARLRMAPDPTMDPEREKQELIKLSAKKSKKKAEDAGFGTRRKRAGYTRKRAGHDVWSDDEEPEYEGSEDEDDTGGSRSAKRKAERERKGPGEYQEDDFVVADESDEDIDHSGEGKSGKKRRRREEEEDPLDRLDAKISQQQEHERRRKIEDSAQHGDDDQEMEVESEEDDEEHKIRKVGSGVRKKRAVTFGEDEEE
ncbi:Leo1-like protein-domain-containing protein [Phlebopus sp. FC_14]|nr:Leo1-like protein-domain-containing protein [Phlebopus sp. FC_14]